MLCMVCTNILQIKKINYEATTSFQEGEIYSCDVTHIMTKTPSFTKVNTSHISKSQAISNLIRYILKSIN